jgi:hypothetical protein
MKRVLPNIKLSNKDSKLKYLFGLISLLIFASVSTIPIHALEPKDINRTCIIYEGKSLVIIGKDGNCLETADYFLGEQNGTLRSVSDYLYIEK